MLSGLQAALAEKPDAHPGLAVWGLRSSRSRPQERSWGKEQPPSREVCVCHG